MSFVFLEKAFVSKEEAKIPITDRGLLFGDGAYATIQVRDGIPLFLSTHITRLTEQCRSFGLNAPDIDTHWVEHLIELNKAETGIWKLKIVVTGGDNPVYELPSRDGRLFMFMERHEPLPMQPLKVGLFSYPFTVCHAFFKSLAHLNRFYVMQEAKKERLDDCITLTEKKIVLEAAFGNLFWVEGNRLSTPCPTLPIYFGVTITNVIAIAKQLNYEIAYAKMPVDQLPQNANYFRTNSMGGIRCIEEIGTRIFEINSKIHARFIEMYEDLIAATQNKKKVSV